MNYWKGSLFGTLFAMIDLHLAAAWKESRLSDSQLWGCARDRVEMVVKVHYRNILGGQICRHVENAFPKQSHNVWWVLISFQEFDSCTQHHVYPALGKTSSAERGFFCRKLNTQFRTPNDSEVYRVRKLSESQPRTQASSRYPSYQRRLGAEYDSAKAWQAWQVTSHPKSPRKAGDEAEWIRFYSRLL